MTAEADGWGDEVTDKTPDVPGKLDAGCEESEVDEGVLVGAVSSEVVVGAAGADVGEGHGGTTAGILRVDAPPS